MSMLRLHGGCIAFVPISPDVTKIPFPNLLSRTIGQILRVGADRRVRPHVFENRLLTIGIIRFTLARWMHRVRAEVAGCNAKSR